MLYPHIYPFTKMVIDHWPLDDFGCFPLIFRSIWQVLLLRFRLEDLLRLERWLLAQVGSTAFSSGVAVVASSSDSSKISVPVIPAPNFRRHFFHGVTFR